MQGAPAIFDRYEEVRGRLPDARGAGPARDIAALTEIADQAAAFVFDAFGVLNVGETLIDGADHRVEELRARGCAIRILTNAASYDRAGALAKFRALGIGVTADEIITSRAAALAGLTPGLWGAIAAAEDAMNDIEVDLLRLGDDLAAYGRVDGFLFLSSSGWTIQRQQFLESALLARDRPVLIANADLVAPRDDGFSLEPGHFGHLLVDRGLRQVRFFGKPFAEVYEMVEQSLPGIPRDRIVMCGDTLHTDILGAAARGWRTVLVTRDGLFAGHDTAPFSARSGITPDWRLARI